jgi:DNA-binding CsgD family transcriptional regulator
MVESRDSRVYSVILGRAQRLGAWGAAEMGTLAVVQHHLSAALEIRSHLHNLEAMRRAVDTVVESLDEAVFIIGRKDDLLFANNAGKALLRRDCLVGRREGQLTAFGRPNRSRWITALRQARGPRACAALTLSDDPGSLRHATTIVSARNTPSLLDLGSEADLVIFIHDPAHSAPTTRHLQLVFELTRREAEVVILLAEGLSPKAISTSLRVSVETVRSHLKRVLQKTGAHSQAELVANVLRSVQPIRISSTPNGG